MNSCNRIRLLGIIALLAWACSPLAHAETFETEQGGKSVLCGSSGSSWIPGSLVRSTFSSFAAQRAKKRAAQKKASGKKLLQLKQQAKALTTRIKSEGPVCALGPPEEEEPPSDNGDYFDRLGDLTAAGKLAFGVPSELGGNVTSGRILHDSNSCKSCHTEKTNSSYSFLQQALQTEPSMSYLAESLSSADVANLVAYLNRFRIR